jgi:arabinoxylan arabinofuranohydrolase
VLTVKVTNGDDIAVAANLVSPYGSKSITALAAGKSASQVFTTRLAATPAGVVEVTATATVDGQPVSTVVEAAYPAHSCG